MAASQPQHLEARQRGLGAARGFVLAILPGVAVWIVLALILWAVI